jgi:transposase
MTEYTIGIDISKSHLDAFHLEDETAKRFENSPRGFRALIKWLGAAQIVRIVFEPTGPYHRAFEEALSGKLPLVKVNPLKARRFAEACGAHAKTDAVDARTLARMGEALGLEPDQPISHKLRNLKDLQIARIGLVKDRTRLRNRGHMQTNTVLKRQIKTRLALVERQIKELDAEIAKHIAEDQSTARQRDILCSMPGLGPVSAAMVIAFLPEIGKLARKQAGSLAGLAPYNRESGMWKGRSVISGGRKPYDKGGPAASLLHLASIDCQRLRSHWMAPAGAAARDDRRGGDRGPSGNSDIPAPDTCHTRPSREPRCRGRGARACEM